MRRVMCDLNMVNENPIEDTIMATTKLSSKGQVIIPKPIRAAHHWETGQELVVIDLGDGILLKPKTPFAVTDINEAASCLKCGGPAKSIDDMNRAIQKGVLEQIQGSD